MAYIFPIERSDQRSLLACAVVFSLLTITAVSLRLLARLRANQKLDASDCLIVAACIVSVVYQALSIASVMVGGMGWHYAEVISMGGEDSFTTLMKLVTAITICWSLSLGLAKGSVLLLYAKVFSVPSFILLSKATAVFVFLWACVLFIGSFVICTPVQLNWDKFNYPDGQCGDTRLLWAITGGLNILTDLLIILLPMPYLYGLNLALYKKLVLMATFGIGILVCVISSIRLAEIISIDMADFPHTGAIALLFSALEPCLLTTAACVPLLRPLLSGRGLGDSSAATPNYSDGLVTYGGSGGTRPNQSKMSSSGFDKLPDDGSSTEHLRVGDSDAETHGALVGKQNGGKKDDGFELGPISVQHDWKVEARQATSALVTPYSSTTIAADRSRKASVPGLH